jgi:hypothetical protein
MNIKTETPEVDGMQIEKIQRDVEMHISVILPA